MLVVWQRRAIQSAFHRFQYGVFAHGGIDVNALLGNYNFSNQNEVTFPGGIRREFIRSARQYGGTRLVAIWDNPYFDPTQNGPYAPSWQDLPHVIRGTNVPVFLFPYFDGSPFPPASDHHDELRRKREAGGDELDLMWHANENSEELVDPLTIYQPLPRLSRSCILHSGDSNTAFSFAGTPFVRIEGGTTDGTIIRGPNQIASWQTLRTAGSATINAILRRPDMDNTAWFFSFDKYAQVTFKSDTDPGSVLGPRDIADDWAPLRSAGFRTVDAACPVPRHANEAYFFSGESYVRINIKTLATVNGPPCHYFTVEIIKASRRSTPYCRIPKTVIRLIFSRAHNMPLLLLQMTLSLAVRNPYETTGPL